MADIEYLNFNIVIAETATGYEVRADSPQGPASAPFQLPVSDEGLRLIHSQIQNAVLKRSTRVTTRRATTGEFRELQRFGAQLFDALIREEVRERYFACYQKARQEQKGLRLSLRAPRKLETVPWEFLYNPTTEEFVGLSRYEPIVRYLDVEHFAQHSLKVEPPLNLVVVIASPRSDYYEPLNVERERRVIEEALGDLQKRGLVTLHFIHGPDTDRQLANVLARDCHILHFVCHGGFDQKTQEGVLAFENESGKPKLVGSDDLRMLLRDSRTTQLVFLNACEGTVSNEGDSFSSVAGGLVRAGVPAVVAMQFEVSDDAAIRLARFFYTRLADNYPVDAALAEARKGVKLAAADTVEWGTPVLFMRVSDGQLFELAVVDQDKRQQHQSELFELYQVGKRLYEQGQWREARQILSRVQRIRDNFQDTAEMLAVCQREVERLEAEDKKRAQVAALFNQAQSAASVEDWATVISQCQSVLALDANHAQAAALLKQARQQQTLAIIYAEARQHFEARQWQAALQSLRRIGELQSDYKDANRLSAIAQKELTREESERVRRERATELTREARAAMARENWQIAIERWQSLQTIEPNNADAAAGLLQARDNLELATLYAVARKQYEARRWRNALDTLNRVKALRGSYKDVDILIANVQREISTPIKPLPPTQAPGLEILDLLAAGSALFALCAGLLMVAISIWWTVAAGAFGILLGGFIVIRRRKNSLFLGGALAVMSVIGVGIIVLANLIVTQWAPSIAIATPTPGVRTATPTIVRIASPTTSPIRPTAPPRLLTPLPTPRIAATVAPTTLSLQDQNSILSLLSQAQTAESQAYYWLNPQAVQGVYTGSAYNRIAAEIQSLSGQGMYALAVPQGGQVLTWNIVSRDSQQVTAISVRSVETWSTQFYSIQTRLCLWQVINVQVPQTIYIRREAGRWIIYDVVTDNIAQPPQQPC